MCLTADAAESEKTQETRTELPHIAVREGDDGSSVSASDADCAEALLGVGVDGSGPVRECIRTTASSTAPAFPAFTSVQPCRYRREVDFPNPQSLQGCGPRDRACRLRPPRPVRSYGGVPIGRPRRWFRLIAGVLPAPADLAEWRLGPTTALSRHFVQYERSMGLRRQAGSAWRRRG
jgi:hypothetical protein